MDPSQVRAEVLNGSVPQIKVFVGSFVHSTKDEPMVILEDTVLGVVDTTIKFVEPIGKLNYLMEQYGFSDSDITYLNSSQFMMPGFVDTHIHAPQFPNNGLKLNLPLLQWLENYTFPTEAKFSDVEFASYVYPRVVDRLLRNGTTTASYFASIHLPATKILTDIICDKGQRALVGKVSMLVNSPDYYRESSLEDSLRENEEFIHYVKSLNSPLVHPIVTPRFAPTCPTEQLEALGQLARKYSCHVQSHLSETRPETAWVKELFPWSKSYTNIYEKTNLLGTKTIMAHCIWLDDTEIQMLKAYRVGVSHCPNSNLSIRSGLCDVQRLLNNGIKVGLGTDCSGGYSPSILDSIRQAVQTSNTLGILHEGYQHLSLYEVFRLATLGGAQVVDMEDRIGNFETAKEFDALLIDMGVADTAVDIDPKDTLEDRVQKFLLNGDDRNIVQVYVAGRKIHDRQTTQMICNL